MEKRILSMRLDLREGSKDAVISGEAVVIDGEAKVFLNVSWDSAIADELSIEVNESSISRIITSESPDAASLLEKRRSGIMFDSLEAAVRNIASFTGRAPHWYAPAA